VINNEQIKTDNHYFKKTINHQKTGLGTDMKMWWRCYIEAKFIFYLHVDLREML